MVITGRGLAVLLALTPGLAWADPRDGKRLIITGWDNPASDRFARWTATGCAGPFDGVVVEPVRAGGSDALNRRLFRETFSATPWSAEWMIGSIADLKRGAGPRGPGGRETFVVVNANPGSVDWFDDTAWAAIIAHWEIAARVAKQGGARGLVFDPEPYVKPYSAFRYGGQAGGATRTFDATRAKVRERGRAVMRTIGREFPDAVILSYFLLSYCLDAVPRGGGDPAGLARHSYGLLPAFLEGWLDAVPPGLALVDGCESSYCYNGEREFLDTAVRVKGDAQALLDPAVRSTYRAQVEVGFGLYLDAYANPPGSKYFVDGLGGSRIERLRANTRTALTVADRYVWLYGEQGRWWPADADGGDADAPAPWERVLPGCSAAIDWARDPARAAVEWLAGAGRPNRVRNGGCDARAVPGNDAAAADWSAGDAPPGWSAWQDEASSHGTFAWDRAVGAAAPGSAKLAGVHDGFFIQKIPVRPGERYAVAISSKSSGGGEVWVKVRWQAAAGKWTAWDEDVTLRRTGAPATPDGWTRWVGGIAVPAGVERLVLLPGVGSQRSETDAVWFDDAVLSPMP